MRAERRLAIAGGALFLALLLVALGLWLREGQSVYVQQILSGIANCL